MSAEVKFLLAASHHRPDAGQRAEIGRRAAAPLDWSLVLALAQGHRLLPLISTNQADFRHAVPVEVQQAMARAQVAVTARTTLLHAELVRLLGLFEAQGIPALAYKGAALGVQAYGALMTRDYQDLDVMVRPSDLTRARQAVLASGYLAKHPGDQSIPDVIRRSECDETLVHERTGVSVELHWAVTPPYFSLPLPIESLFEAHVSIDTGSFRARCPRDEDTVLLLAVNGTKDGWMRLEHVCAVAHLIRRTDGFDWAYLFRRASAANAARMVHVALQLAQRLYAAAVPAPWAEQVAGDRAAGRLVGRIERDLLALPPSSPGWLSRTARAVGSRERWRDQLRFCALRAITPTREDALALPLPRPLWPTYYLLRPWRLAWQRLAVFVQAGRR